MKRSSIVLSIFISVAIITALFHVHPAQTQAQVASEFQIVIDHTAHLKYGLYYPVTYMFTIPGGSTGLTAQYRYGAGDAWSSMPTMTNADFFNGLTATRFDYPRNTAYLSIRFSDNSDVIYVRLIDNLQQEVPISYSGMPLYYDNRRSAVNVSLDDWDWAAASRILTNAHIHYTIAIWSNFNPDWPTIQFWYNQGYLEPGAHTRDHPCTDSDYIKDGGYDYQISGVRDDILANLTLREPYIPAFILPCGFESTAVRAAIVKANYLSDRGAAWGGNAYGPWGNDGAYQQTEFTYSTFDWAGTQTAARRDAANAAFDDTYNNGGVYYLTDHPADGYWVDGSYLAQHISYISNRPDVWYAGYGELYLYHYVQERGMVNISPAGPPLATFTPTFTPTQAPEVTNPANISTLPDGTNVLLNFNNFPDQVNGAAVPPGFAGLTWNSLVEGPPWAGIVSWNFYIIQGKLQGTITFPRPVLMKSLLVSSANNNTVTLSSPLNPDASTTTPANSPGTIAVNWTNPITTLTIKSSTGDQAFDDLRFIVLSSNSNATATPTALATATATLLATATRTSTVTATPTTTAAPTTGLPSPTFTSTATAAPTVTPTATAAAAATFTPTTAPTSTPLPDLIFSDGFETGNLSQWSSSVTNGGRLSVSTAAAQGGTYGLQVAVANNNPAYVQNDAPNSEARYRARFYFSPNSISMGNGNSHPIFYGYQGTSTVVLRIEFRFSSGAYQLRVGLVNNATSWKTSNWFTISNASHFVELDWSAAASSGTSNGYLTFWIDGIQQASVTGVTNDTRRIDMVRLGPVTGVQSGTRGTYFFDTFESRRSTLIGR